MIEIRAEMLPKIGFASHQNAVPLIADLQIENTGTVAIGPVTLALKVSPAFISQKIWQIDRLAPRSTLRINDRAVAFDGGMLAELNEALRAELRFSLTAGDEELAAAQFEVECLPRLHWGGMAMPGLLAAFCMPNDPAVDKLLKSASDLLRSSGKLDALNGYHRDATGVWELASAIWSAVAGLRLSYVLPPASFEIAGQKTRSPSAILESRVATCLDSSLLFAACLEQAGLHPIIVMPRGHAFAGVWLRDTSFSELILEDAEAIRKHVALNELLVFETTLITQNPPASFSQAIESAKRQVEEEKDANFHAALDIKRARFQRIRPLGSVAEPAPAVPSTPEGALALEPAPFIPPFTTEKEPPVPDTPAGRLANWQRKLLDLTTRNRLLHVPENAKAVTLLCHDAMLLEQRLASGTPIRISALPDLGEGGRDAKMYEQQHLVRLKDEFTRMALEEKSTLLSELDKTRLEAMLIDLYRSSRSDLQEGGANTLFLAIGFLRWKKSPSETRGYRAPLILLPVKLERKSALSGVVMQQHEDEPRFNLTLLELLRQDFALNIPGLDGALPTNASGSGVDIAAIWQTVRIAVRDIQGFELVETVMLGTFSFGKYLMWKDLADRGPQLAESPVVKHLVERGAERFPSGGHFPAPNELDQTIDPARLFLPLPADSSQIAAIVASANGCDFVLDGPPGTGKSQTIANMIAQNLALGRRVLFVAEKMAALNVVYRRLEEKGLGEFCLQLHSNKASKQEVLTQLERAWDTRDALPAETWAKEASQLKQQRDHLNSLVALLHKVQPNGLTLHRAIGVAVRNADLHAPRLSWPDGTLHDEADITRLRDIVRRLAISAAHIEGSPAALGALKTKSWSNAWQEQIVDAAQRLPNRIAEMQLARDNLLEATGLNIPANDSQGVSALCALVEAIRQTYGQSFRFAFAVDNAATAEAAAKATAILAEHQGLVAKLSVPFGDIPGIAVPALEMEWELANKKFWFLATSAKKKLAAKLAAQGSAAGTPDPASDLPRLRRIQHLAGELSTLAPRLHDVPGWDGLNTDTGRMTAAIATAATLKAAITVTASTPDDLSAMTQAAIRLAVEANGLLAPEGRIAQTHEACIAALARLAEISAQFTSLIVEEASLNTLGLLATAVVSNQPRLKSWCDWKRVSDEALLAGLQPLLHAVEQGAAPTALSDLFETAYARWFAAQLIDAEPRLAQFMPDVHASDIETFRKLEDTLSRLAVRYIRAQICGRIPNKNDVGKKDGYGILKHQLQLQRRHKPIRQLAAEMGDAFTRLAPCMLMSPLSIAQYLPPDQALFDLVIFDEASQIAPWDAVGAMARGRQVVIAGDPRQMPPTNFFGRAAAEDDTVDGDESDMESILDECLGAGLPQHTLEWHYRSQHESLIAFSNSRYYENRLITFPAPVTRASAVSWRRVDGVYAKGKGRTNQAEAEAMVAEVVTRLTDAEFAASGKTLGIIVLNADQQKLIEDLLDQARRREPALERFFGEAALEPVFVKNLETVQGDERDIILIGIGFGPTEPGAPVMSMNFGPLNRDGGWRRLNVAITRARAEMMLFTSFDSAMVDLNRTSARAVRDLKHFIEFAERGPRSLAEAVHGSVGGFDSPFEEAVADALTRKGWQVVTQIGVSRFRIDLGIVHPDRPGDYLVGVECDGAAYHSAATARDRDKVRQAILETLGWKLLRIWSTDWWVDKAGATEKLHAAISALLEADRARRGPDDDEVELAAAD